MKNFYLSIGTSGTGKTEQLTHLSQTDYPCYPEAIRSILEEKIDPRARSGRYKMNDIIWSTVMMFFLRLESRNAMNALREDETFKAMFEKMFNHKLPHLDTCHLTLSKIKPEDLKVALYETISFLIENKFFSSSKTIGYTSFLPDGSGIGTVEVPESLLIPKEKEKDEVVPLISESFFLTKISSDKKIMNASIWATGKTSKNGSRYFKSC